MGGDTCTLGQMEKAAGPLLRDAAAYAADAQRLLIAAMMSAEQAAADIEDMAELIAEADAEPIGWSATVEGVGAVALELQRIADVFAHREVRRASQRPAIS